MDYIRHKCVWNETTAQLWNIHIWCHQYVWTETTAKLWTAYVINLYGLTPLHNCGLHGSQIYMDWNPKLWTAYVIKTYWLRPLHNHIYTLQICMDRTHRKSVDCIRNKAVWTETAAPLWTMLTSQIRVDWNCGLSALSFIACEDLERIFDNSFPACDFFSEVEITYNNNNNNDNNNR